MATASLKSLTATTSTTTSSHQCQHSPTLPLWSANGVGCGGHNGKFSVPLRPGNGVIDLDATDGDDSIVTSSENRLQRRSRFDLGEQYSLDILQAGVKKQKTYDDHAKVTDTQTTVGVDLETDCECHEPLDSVGTPKGVPHSPPRILKANWSCMSFESSAMQVTVPVNVSANIASDRVNACIHPDGLKANWSCMVLPDDP